MAELDKFYTNREIAKECIETYKRFIHFDKTDIFLEPTSGDGAFLDFLENYEAYDIKPEDYRVRQQDILLFEPEYKHYLTIGNPPFGKRSKLAIEIINKISEYSDVIGFILPISFKKFSVQKQITDNLRLIYCEQLPKNSFLDREKVYDVNSVFQIWIKKNSKYDIYEDIRLKKNPPSKHPDLELWQYNCTEDTKRYIDEDWEFAIYRQGYKDYNSIFTKEDKENVREMMNRIQFFFIKPLTDEARKIVLEMDFNELASRNTATPGFGKADFVDYYTELKNKKGNL